MHGQNHIKNKSGLDEQTFIPLVGIYQFSKRSAAKGSSSSP